MTARTRVFLTGAAGNWGRRILDEFRGRADHIDVVALVRPTPRDLETIHLYEDMPNLDVVFGDLTDYDAVERCVRGADYVLHVGAAVSPTVDDFPGMAMRVNPTAIQNIVDAVKMQPDPSQIAVIGVGTVAETGNRSEPHHWGRVGDPLRVAVFDEYGQSKIIAEKILVDSGLPRWAWLRQTGIFHPGVLEIRDPIMTHSPFNGVMEWVSVEDSARLMANICEPEVPAEFWGEVYNIGGGAGWRLTNWELQTRMTSMLGVKDVRKWYDRNWFATQNFHGHWYSDSDRLEELVPFREDTFEDALARAVRANPALKVAGKVPPVIIKNLVMKPLTRRPRGTMRYIDDDDRTGIDAFFGSREAWEQIGGWDTFWPPRPSHTPTTVDFGFDETKPRGEWGRADYREAADFRGGTLVTTEPSVGDFTTPLEWSCSAGHTFTGSPRLILSAGHWCPTCVLDSVNYDTQSERNQFLAQIQRTQPGASRS